MASESTTMTSASRKRVLPGTSERLFASAMTFSPSALPMAATRPMRNGSKGAMTHTLMMVSPKLSPILSPTFSITVKAHYFSCKSIANLDFGPGFSAYSNTPLVSLGTNPGGLGAEQAQARPASSLLGGAEQAHARPASSLLGGAEQAHARPA